MNLRRLPILPTVIVLAAVIVMAMLGFWQLDRMKQKEALLARYASSEGQTAEVAWPADAATAQDLLFRRSRFDCRPEGAAQPIAGHNARGVTGWAHVQICVLPGGQKAQLVLGWARDLNPRQWAGGTVTGTIAPGAGQEVRLVADPPLAGLEASARPDPRSIPNNHLSYAVQWFLFALTALTIYGLVLRKRLRD